MNLKNNTKNQHFISQVEQRLNAINPQAFHKDQRIYSFSVKNRENYKISLDNEKGMHIHRNLSFNDLFSFDVIDGGSERFNFEPMFQQYESDIKTNTITLISKLDSGCVDVQTEVKNIYHTKFLNFLRNPYSIEKMLNTFDIVNNYYPTDPDVYARYNAVRSGRKPQQKHLCSELGISDKVYDDWLWALFMLLHKLEGGKTNLMEITNNTLFTDPLNLVSVIICKYENTRCLLSDRGFSIIQSDNDSLPFDSLSFEFNLCSTAFIRYNFYFDKNAQKNTLGRPGKDRATIYVSYIKNDLDELLIYNQNVIDQCHSKVYCSADEYHGVQVV